MKTRLTTLSVAAALVLVSGTAFAQGSNDTPITRAQVKQELAQLRSLQHLSRRHSRRTGACRCKTRTRRTFRAAGTAVNRIAEFGAFTAWACSR